MRCKILGRRGRHSIGHFFAALALAASVAATAQELGEGLAPPPVRQAVDSMGVDTISGQPAGFGGMSVSIGTAESGIARNPGTARYMHDNHTGTLTEIVIDQLHADNPDELAGLPVGTYVKVDTFGHSELFTQSGSTYTNTKGTGGTLSCSGNLCTYTVRNGTEIEFDRSKRNAFHRQYPPGSGLYSTYENVGLQTQVTRPDGEIVTNTYQTLTGYFGHIPSAVSSSLGWMIKYYFSDKEDEDLSDSQVFRVRTTSSRSITAINTAVEYCDPAARACDALSNTWSTSSMDATWTYTAPQGAGGSEHSITQSSVVTDDLGHSDDHSEYRHSHPSFDSTVSYTSKGGLEYSYTMPGCLTAGGGTCFEPLGTYKVETATARGRSITYSYPATDTIVSPDGTLVSNPRTSRITSFTDRLNRKTRYVFATQWQNDVDLLVNPDATPSVDAPTGGYIDYDYDARRNITAVRIYPKNGGTPLVTTATFPATCGNPKTCNKPLTITDQSGATTTFTYHAQSGNVATITKPSVDGVEAQTRFTYKQRTPKVRNSGGALVNSVPVWRLTEISRCMSMTLNTCVGAADEQKTLIAYDHNNVLPTSKTIMRGDGSLPQQTTMQYDIYGRLEWEDGPRPGSYDRRYYYYDLLGRRTGEIDVDPDGPGPLPRKAVRTVYDADGHITSLGTGVVQTVSESSVEGMVAAIEVQTDYDDDTGLPTRERTYAGGLLRRVTQNEYDDRRNLECSARRLNPSTYSVLPASACALGAAGPDGNDRITKYGYDLTDALTTITEAYGTPRERVTRTAILRPDNGLLDSEKDGNGNTTFYKYDDYNRLWRTVYADPEDGTIESTSDYVQNNYTGPLITSVRLRDGQTIGFQYDAVGRIKAKTGAVSESTTYNNFDQIVGRTNNTTGGAPITSTYLYNSLGWKHSETSSLGTVSYDYDPYGRRSRLTWPDGFYITYDYEVGGYPSDNLQAIKEQDTIVLASFMYDKYGLRESLSVGNGVITNYYYDDLTRPESFAVDMAGSLNDVEYEFTYTIADQVKTRTIDSENAEYLYLPAEGPAQSYGINALNQIESVNETPTNYDARGNLTADGVAVFSYNANNLMTSITSGSGSTAFTYDAENRLHSIATGGTSTYFMYDGGSLIAETDAGGNVLHRYVHGPKADEPLIWYVGTGTGNKRYYHSDYQHNTISITDDSGSVYAINSYDEYGVQSSGNSGRFRFTGQVWLGEASLYYYKARLYHPSLGRFMQTDPIGYRDGLNWYAYVGNDPVNRTDSAGLAKVCAPSSDACVFVDGNGDGDASDEDLSAGQMEWFGSEFAEFIESNDGKDLSASGLEVRGFKGEQESTVRAGSQFVGASLPNGWGRFTAIENNSSLSRSARAGAEVAGRFDFDGSGNPVITLNFGNKYVDLNSPSELARTLFHEYGHLYLPGSHAQIDSYAREMLKRSGLSGGGCSPVGYTQIGPFRFGGYPGC